MDERTFYEFFAGGGMARAGLGPGWRCLFANDIDPRKIAAYRANWGDAHLHPGDIRALHADDLPGAVDLAWASFPCQDLSVAGLGAGLAGERSGTFFGFWRLIEHLARQQRAPRLVAIENVVGAINVRGGRDFATICQSLVDTGYQPGCLIIDGAMFVPQSRPRMFLLGVRADVTVPPDLAAPGPRRPFHPTLLQNAFARLPLPVRAAWFWWRLPDPPARVTTLTDLIETDPADVRWHAPAETARLLSLMTPNHLAKIEAARQTGGRVAGGVYRRTRPDVDGIGRQRAEVRFDGVAGCLRTGAGGSSRQFLILVEGDTVRTRLLSGRETARLMGLPDSYQLPRRYTDACHLTGDGVVVPAVRFLARVLLEPILIANRVRPGLPDQLVAAAAAD